MSRFKTGFKFIYKIILLFFKIIKILISSIPILFKYIGFIFIPFKRICGSIINRLKRLLRFSLTFKITFVYGIVISLILFLSTMGILLGFRFFLMHQTHENISKISNIIIDHVAEEAEIPVDKINEISKYENIEISLFDKNKKILYTSNNRDDDIIFHDNFNSPSIIQQAYRDNLILNNKINLNDSILYLQLSKSLDFENTSVSILSIILLTLNILAILIIIVIGCKLSKKMLSPIKDMSETVNEINVQNLDTRLDVSESYDELRDLAINFNDMFDRIQASYEKQNQFVSDASHELRTPISVIQGYINLLDRWGKGDIEVLDESIDAIKSESQGMKDLIEKLLFLARSDKDLLQLQIEDFYIDQLINEIAYETNLIDSKHEIIWEANEKVVIAADRKLIKQAFRILIDNSIKFTPEDGKIKIKLFTEKRNVMVTIEDSGIGIPKEDIPLIFNRFYRSDKSRAKKTGGHGLGLSIAKWIIDKHKGYIKVESEVNIGTKFKIFLPHKRLSGNR
ncbi:sensor histidine kinase [Maledivibacter halophilus]|uniref:histidine kinase n=1 Tax=Maledivibacter halophilus TaxID=36842 RepID=A0A1T5MAX4_9FIRM|nr:ATP-binding protein [Maledivibacter halophilus]SKC85243.1 Signal transduction histidine kinase [Maledivibacter halophilus]